MSSKSTIAKVQGKSALRRTNIGHSKSLEALMVNITWTDAKVVRIQANKDFTMAASTVKVLRGAYEVLADAPVSVKAGQVIYFVASDGFPGWYYVLTYSEARSAFMCSCPSCYHFHRQCGHQGHALAFVSHRYAQRIETEHRIDADLDAHIEDELVEWVRMPNGTQRIASQVNDACLNSLDAMSEAYAEEQCQWEASQERAYENLASVA